MYQPADRARSVVAGDLRGFISGHFTPPAPINETDQRPPLNAIMEIAHRFIKLIYQDRSINLLVTGHY